MENVSSMCGKSDNAPRLRFPEFSGEWEEKKLGEIFFEVNERKHPELPVLSVQQGIGTVFRDTSERRISYDKSNINAYKVIEPGDFIIHLRSFEGGLECSKHKGISSPAYKILRSNCINSDAFKDYFRSYNFIEGKLAAAVTGIRDGKNIDMPTFWSLKINIPSLPEQKKIAAFFMLLDRRIQKQRQLVNALKTYKRGVIFSIFKEDNPFGIQIKKTPLSELLTEYRNRNTENLMVCSVAVGKGVVNQIEHLGRSFAAVDTSNYGKVKPGDIVYTKSPTGNFPYGIVKQSRQKQDVAVSPLYGVYTPKSFSAGTLIHNYFEQSENANNYIRPLAQKGAKNTINITTSYFLKGSIPFLESENDVEKFANFFNLLDEKIQQTENFLHNLSMQKKELLHRMFI